ncbi:MAG: rod shape-determining protein RodA [Candidatus Omnitrophica bacterium]|nr:rod shape-determining protein RodA [Candidatus Omnitrophota bacterium]MDD5736781.1 rod shape-determining protein RodA [Candidatus Omnitrophota bacterium]
MKYELRAKGEFDYGLVAIAGVIILMGLFVIYSASYQKYVLSGTNLSLRQLQSAIIGILIAAAVFRIGYQRIIDFGYYIFGISVILLVLVLFVGDMRYGARRWMEIGSFAFQPSEFAKITFIFAIAKYLGDIKDGIGSPKALVAPFVMALVPMLLIFKEPDLGTALVFVPVLFTMLFMAGARLKYLMILIGSGLACAPFLWFFLKEYQRNRLMVFMNPNLDPLGAGYTIIQSKIAIGSGGIIGKGWLAGTQNQLNFLPEHHTDFIFSVVGEEWGFIGSAVLLFLFYKLVEKGLRIAETTSDIYGKTLAYGIVTVFAMHTIVNIGMVCGLMPVVGIPLPLVSYGGSSLIMSIVSIGILENIKNKRKVF